MGCGSKATLQNGGGGCGSKEPHSHGGMGCGARKVVGAGKYTKKEGGKSCNCNKNK